MRAGPEEILSTIKMKGSCMDRHQPVFRLRLACLLGVLFSVSGLAPSAHARGGDVLLGKEIYNARCVECHGRDGKGDGPAAPILNPRPRDFTAGKFKFRSTETGSIPLDADLLRTIENGLHNTAMPAWKGPLGNDSVAAVLTYIKTFSPRFQQETPKPVAAGIAVPTSPASIESGRVVYESLQCAGCHGTDGAGKDAVASGLTDDWGFNTTATNLTEPWTFRTGASASDIYARLRTGLDGSPMPSFKGSATDRQMWDLANYIVSLGRKPAWRMSADELQSLFASEKAKALANPVERGGYLVSTLGCAYCHSPVTDDGSIIEGMQFAGGQKWDLYPYDIVVSYNLTSDKETGLGNWTDDQIKTFVTKGIRRDGSRMVPFPMPWPAFASLNAEDLNAIVAYLRTIPPVHNKIPEPKSHNIFSYLWGKFQMLILKKDLPLHTYSGNAGSTQEKPSAMNAADPAEKSREVRP